MAKARLNISLDQDLVDFLKYMHERIGQQLQMLLPNLF